MYRALIVDDERLARVVMRDLLAEHADIEVVGEADSVEFAARLLKKLTPDLVFLDIEMPDGSGFELFERVKVSSHVVFVTAYDEHALRAFEVNALDYLVKPVDPAHVERALTRFRRLWRLPPELERPRPERRLALDDIACLQEARCMTFARVGEITRVCAADEYAEVHLTSGEAVLVSTRLSRWEERLPECFVRVHRSILVNLHHVMRIEQVGGAWVVHLRGADTTLAMSRRYAQALRKRLNDAG